MSTADVHFSNTASCPQMTPVFFCKLEKPVSTDTGQQASKGGRTEEARGQAAAAATRWGCPQQEGGYPLPRHHGTPGRGHWRRWARAAAGRCPHAPATASSLWQVCPYALQHAVIFSAICSACCAASFAKQHLCRTKASNMLLHPGFSLCTFACSTQR